MRVARIQVSPEFLLSLFQNKGNRFACETPLHHDAKLHRVEWHYEKVNIIDLVVESPEFADVPEGAYIPTHTITFGPVAQRPEHPTDTRAVGGSNPPGSTPKLCWEDRGLVDYVER